MGNKKEKFIKEQKEARTIKVRTIVIVGLVLLSNIAFFIGGWQARSFDNARINGEAHALVEQFTVKK